MTTDSSTLSNDNNCNTDKKAIIVFDPPSQDFNNLTTNANNLPKDNSSSSILYDNSALASDKLDRLNRLLEQTSLYSSFLAEKLCQHIQQRTSKDQDHKQQNVLSLQQPKLITGGTLKSYQLEGIHWLASLYENGLNGILADEMGLGKTVQCLGFLCYLMERKVDGPFLIVAPLGTLGGWQGEIKKWCPEVKEMVYHGTKTDRKDKLDEFRKEVATKKHSSINVVLTSYEIVLHDFTSLCQIPWKFVIVDEGHRIKNLNCKLIKALKALPSTNRLLLTGTPLQNSLSELWSLLNFLLPSIFDDLEAFQRWFEDVVETSSEHDDNEGALGTQHARIVNALHGILTPFLLRRLKEDVEHTLPPKYEFIVKVSMTHSQLTYYKAILEGKLFEQLISPKGSLDLVEENGDDFVLANKSVQNELMQLRKACNHPYLFAHPANLFSDHKNMAHVKSLQRAAIEAAGKTRLLAQLLPRLLAHGHRVLIFSQMSRMLDILEVVLENLGLTWCRIDGSTSHEQRQEQLDAFRKIESSESINVFLLSTRAGGLGINLPQADTVIFYDSDWNPQMDLQAQDRAHRIGQTKPVLIIRFMSVLDKNIKNSNHGDTNNNSPLLSVEEIILGRAESKRKLEQVVISKKRFKGIRELLFAAVDHEKKEREEVVTRRLFGPKRTRTEIPKKHCKENQTVTTSFELSKLELEFLTTKHRTEQAMTDNLPPSDRLIPAVHHHEMTSLNELVDNDKEQVALAQEPTSDTFHQDY